MKGRVGTSTGISKGKNIARSFFQKSKRSRRRIEKMGKGALGGKFPDGVIVVAPTSPVQNLQ